MLLIIAVAYRIDLEIRDMPTTVMKNMDYCCFYSSMDHNQGMEEEQVHEEQEHEELEFIVFAAFAFIDLHGLMRFVQRIISFLFRFVSEDNPVANSIVKMSTCSSFLVVLSYVCSIVLLIVATNFQPNSLQEFAEIGVDH